MYFSYRDQNLFWQETNLALVTRAIENQLQQEYCYQGAYYLYHLGILRERLGSLTLELPNADFYYSVKSLSNINILKEINKLKNFGLDVVSFGEIKRGLSAGFSARQIVFAGVGKTAQEMENALRLGIKSFHVESLSELNVLATVCRKLGCNASLALRLNPDLEAETHHYIATGKKENKFGLSARDLPLALQTIRNESLLNLVGLQAHVGSQIKNTRTHIELLKVLLAKARELTQSGFTLEYLSLGGGFGVDYEHDFANHPTLEEFHLSELAQGMATLTANTPWKISFEPGRFVSAYAGMLVTHVLYLKEKEGFQIAVVDAAMNDLIRPALYDAKHPLAPLRQRGEETSLYDVVGPVCESGDFFRKAVRLPALREKDTLFILHTGAYGASMSSRYNSRRLLPEVLIDTNTNIDESSSFRVIRRPETWDEVFATELAL